MRLNFAVFFFCRRSGSAGGDGAGDAPVSPASLRVEFVRDELLQMLTEHIHDTGDCPTDLFISNMLGDVKEPMWQAFLAALAGTGKRIASCMVGCIALFLVL